METKFTPGPWIARPAPYGFDVVVLDIQTDRALWVSSITTGLLGRECPYYPTGEACNANAHLIAAAPDLFEALVELLPAGWDDNDTMDHMPGVAKARAALAKAKGAV